MNNLSLNDLNESIKLLKKENNLKNYEFLYKSLTEIINHSNSTQSEFIKSIYKDDIQKYDSINAFKISLLFLKEKIKNKDINKISFENMDIIFKFIEKVNFNQKNKEQLLTDKLEGKTPITRTELYDLLSNYDEKKYNLSKLNVSKIIDFSNLFNKSNFQGDLSKWDVTNAKYMLNMFGDKYYGDLSKWKMPNLKHSKEEIFTVDTDFDILKTGKNQFKKVVEENMNNLPYEDTYIQNNQYDDDDKVTVTDDSLIKDNQEKKEEIEYDYSSNDYDYETLPKKYTPNAVTLANEIKETLTKRGIIDIDSFYINKYTCDSESDEEILRIQYISNNHPYSTNINLQKENIENVSYSLFKEWKNTNLNEIINHKDKIIINGLVETVNDLKDGSDEIVRNVVVGSINKFDGNQKKLEEIVMDTLLDKVRDSITDKLTKTLSVEYYHDHIIKSDSISVGLKPLLDKLEAKNKKVTIGFVDFNNFKTINDKYNHEMGDEVLKAFTKKLIDINGRINVIRRGGDEFVIVTDNESAKQTIKTLSDVNVIKKICKEVGLKDKDIASISVAFGKSLKPSELTPFEIHKNMEEAEKLCSNIKSVSHKMFGSVRSNVESDEIVESNFKKYIIEQNKNIGLELDTNIFGKSCDNLITISMNNPNATILDSNTIISNSIIKEKEKEILNNNNNIVEKINSIY